jgi:chromatin remodeling complex protein RSC6
MPKQPKSSPKPEVESVSTTETPVLTEPVVSTQVKVEKKRKPKAVSEAVKETPAVVEATVSEPVLESVSEQVNGELPVVVQDETVDAVVVTEKSVEFLTKLQQVSVLVTSLKADYRLLEKQWSRELKLAQKQSSKRKRKAGNRAPSGFVKPTRISDELAKFLGKPVGTEMARTEVTRDINKYIKSQTLQNKGNGRQIDADAKLTALLKLADPAVNPKNETLTYFNLQKFMSPHFEKAQKVVV